MKIIYLMGLFFILGFAQGKFINQGSWLVKDKLPNHWMGHSVWGIFWVVTICLLFGYITLEQWSIMFLLFLSAFPGIYLSGIKQWEKCDIGNKILKQLELIYERIT